MLKDNPTPHNSVFNHEAESLHDAAGICSGKEIGDRIDKLNEKIKSQGVESFSETAEMVMKEFTHKELAVIWTTEVTQIKPDNPLEELFEMLTSRSPEA